MIQDKTQIDFWGENQAWNNMKLSTRVPVGITIKE
jgi:hypothetical protein